MHKPTDTENKKINERREEVQSDLLHDLPDWLQEFKENLVDGVNIETLPILLMNYQWSREQKWNRVRVSTVFILTSQKTQFVISA